MIHRSSIVVSCRWMSVWPKRSVNAFIFGLKKLKKKKKKKDAAFSPHNIVNSFEKQKKKNIMPLALFILGILTGLGIYF